MKNNSNFILLEKINFLTIQRYLQNRHWVKVNSKRQNLAIFVFGNPVFCEVIIPLERGFGDYLDLIDKAINKIAQVEQRDPIQIVNDLLTPPSDIVRFRAKSKSTEQGLITFNEGFSLLENAKKSLFTTACDIANPTLYHKRMSYKSAKQFIDSCYLGQTERGSFVASVVCPFIDSTAGETPTVLTLFNDEKDFSQSFTRKVTRRFMQSLQRVKNAIETGQHSLIEDPNESEVISANFIESIVELGEFGEKDEIEIFVSWSSATPEVNDIPKSVSFTKDYISPMQSVISRLKPKDEGKQGTFVGKVSRAEAEPDSSTRSEGEIIFNFIGDDEKITKASVLLSTVDFSQACEALDKGYNVTISGMLSTSGKIKTIQNPNFKVLN